MDKGNKVANFNMVRESFNEVVKVSEEKKKKNLTKYTFIISSIQLGFLIFGVLLLFIIYVTDSRYDAQLNTLNAQVAKQGATLSMLSDTIVKLDSHTQNNTRNMANLLIKHKELKTSLNSLSFAYMELSKTQAHYQDIILSAHLKNMIK